MVAWPRLVDEPALRAELRPAAAHAAGGPEDLEFHGAVRLELLPLPRVTIERVVLGDRVATAPSTRFEADRIDVEIAPLALLAGRVEPRRLQLVRPRLMLAALPTRLADQALRALDGGALAGVRRVDVIDGSVSLPAAGGRRGRARSTPSTSRRRAKAPTAFGSKARPPSRASRCGWNWRVAAALGTPIALKLALASGAADAPATLDLQGNLRPEAGGSRLAGRLRVATYKTPLPLWLTRALHLEQGAPPFDLQADLTLAASSLRLDDMELALGGGALRGGFALDLVSAPHFDLTLDGTELVATPELIAELRALGPLVASGGGVTGRVELRAATIAWRGGQIRRLRAELALASRGRLDLRHLSATLPGDTALAWDGTGPVSDGSLVGGSLSVQSGELRPLLLWLGLDATDLPPGGLTSLDLTAAASLGFDGVTMNELRARLDSSQARGSVVFVAGQRPRLDLALKLDRVNAALYAPAVPEAAARQVWRERLAAIDGTFDLAVDRLSYDALRGQDLRLRLGLQDGRVAIEEARVGDLGAASLLASGAVDLADDSYDLTGTVEMAQPKPILRLLRMEPPPELQRLAPLRLSGTARGSGVAGAELDLRLQAHGRHGFAEGHARRTA